jgi:hypothetical protein
VWEAVEVKIQKILIPLTRYGKWSTGHPWMKKHEVSLYKKNAWAPEFHGGPDSATLIRSNFNYD